MNREQLREKMLKIHEDKFDGSNPFEDELETPEGVIYKCGAEPTDEEQFYALLDRMKEIHDAKRHDYASDEDRFSNLMLCEQLMDIPGWKGVIVRKGDKYSRLCEFSKKEEYKVKDESVEDTFLDDAIYSLIGIILYRRDKKKREAELREQPAGSIEVKVRNHGAIIMCPHCQEQTALGLICSQCGASLREETPTVEAELVPIGELSQIISCPHCCQMTDIHRNTCHMCGGGI